MTNGHNGDRPRAFRRVAASFATGVAVVTSVDDDVPVGMTVNSFTTVSLDPVLVLVCLSRGSRLLGSIEHSGVFAATVLAAQQQRQARWFANRARPTGVAAFAGIPTRHAPATGCLLLAEGLAYFDCRVQDMLPGGDHTVVLGEVAAFDELWPREPLVFVGGTYVGVERRPTRLGHWAAPVVAAASDDAVGAGVATGTAAVSPVPDAGAGLSTSATAWAVTTRR
jgi:flavin reductase (DIM6/NTAB) family NADH-FMN oxidoreductase RutF